MPPRQRNQQAREDFHVPADMQKVADDQPALPTILKTAHDFMRRNKPPLTAEQIQALLPSAQIDTTWTQQDELGLRQAWNNDPLKPHLLDSRGNKHLAPLWRYTLRFMGITVEEIIGPRFNLAYDTSSNQVIRVGGQETHHPHWSSKFCEKLTQLVSHPIWLSQPGAMAVCLQYVVKCRTNDQRQMSWPKDNYTENRFFDVFQTVNHTFQSGTMTVTDLHDEVERRMNGIPSQYSRLFRAIEDAVFDAQIVPLRAPGNAGSDVGTYIVTTGDLSTLIEALGKQADIHGLPIYRPAAYTAVAAKTAKKSYDLPRESELGAAREKSILGVRRYQARAAKVAAQQPPPLPQSGQSIPAVPAAGNNAKSHVGTQTTEPWPTRSPRADSEDSDDFFYDPLEDEPANPHLGVVDRNSSAGEAAADPMEIDDSIYPGVDEHAIDPPPGPTIPALDMSGLVAVEVDLPIEPLRRRFYAAATSYGTVGVPSDEAWTSLR
ncbi:hypothetical protein F5Y00DRAFT_259112 [Daldinia vernicosa]|uniref:uncharacterized protein n=1 Tax=Daldinia vernicosa TaxID=114800 RepID=UPI002007CB4D|nr:uncharacterized protein F5Y00DRAFT_259112 [Daldinia vernicosa]KAI0852153.1 hypothetical protein F5Y00DRAFT_259112 [Daldinia vernicosa]